MFLELGSSPLSAVSLRITFPIIIIGIFIDFAISEATLLPDPGSLGEKTKGKTCIGTIVTGKKNNLEKTYYTYNICNHEDCFKEVGSQAISYTTGVPAMIGSLLMLKKSWVKPGVWNMEQFDPDPFMELLNKHGLPTKTIQLENKVNF